MPEPTEPRPGLLHERDLRRRAADLLRATHRTWESVLPSRREPWSQFDAYVSALLANADLLQELTDAAKRRRTPPGRSRPVPEPTEPRPDHRLATEVGGHPVIPLPVHWRMGAHGDPIAEFDYITLHLWPDGSVTWKDETEAEANDDA